MGAAWCCKQKKPLVEETPFFNDENEQKDFDVLMKRITLYYHGSQSFSALEKETIFNSLVTDVVSFLSRVERYEEKKQDLLSLFEMSSNLLGDDLSVESEHDIEVGIKNIEKSIVSIKAGATGYHPIFDILQLVKAITSTMDEKIAHSKKSEHLLSQQILAMCEKTMANMKQELLSRQKSE